VSAFAIASVFVFVFECASVSVFVSVFAFESAPAFASVFAGASVFADAMAIFFSSEFYVMSWTWSGSVGSWDGEWDGTQAVP